MDEDLKNYADSVYESARMESGRTRQQERSEAIQKGSFSRVSLPLSGVDIQLLIKISSNHVERCMLARLDSYKEAFAETNGTPSDEDLAAILEECRAVRMQEVKNALAEIRNAIGSRGVPFLPDSSTLEQHSAHGHDRVLDHWKIWKAKVRLKPAVVEVTEREKQRDPLVSTYNKAEFDLDLEHLTREGTDVHPVSLLFMDLDKFKSINDGPGGHEAGNRALKAFAASLRRVCDGKGSVYRWGGDELCVLLPNYSIEEAAAVAERIRRAVRAIRTDELPDGLKTSIGVACFPESTLDLSKLVSQADEAMYASKKTGGNLVSKASTSAEPVESRQRATDQDSLAEVISELEDNLERARAPRIGDAYRRPSSRAWKNGRNKIGLPAPLSSDVIQIYREIDDWLTVVESGVHPNMGSPALNNTTASLATRLPWVIVELKKLI